MDRIAIALWVTWMFASVALTFIGEVVYDNEKAVNMGLGGLATGVGVVFLGMFVGLWMWAL